MVEAKGDHLAKNNIVNTKQNSLKKQKHYL